MKPSATSPTSPTTSSILRRALKGEALVRGRLHSLRSYPHGHVAAVLGSLKQLGLHTLARPASRRRDLVVAMIVARVIDARSKLATARQPGERCSTLGQILGLEAVDEMNSTQRWTG